MLKNSLFFEKSWKNCRSVGGSAPKPPLTADVFIFKHYSNFSASFKLRPMLYLSLERWLLGPLSQACPPSALTQTSSYVTVLKAVFWATLAMNPISEPITPKNIYKYNTAIKNTLYD